MPARASRSGSSSTKPFFPSAHGLTDRAAVGGHQEPRGERSSTTPRDGAPARPSGERRSKANARKLVASTHTSPVSQHNKVLKARAPHADSSHSSSSLSHSPTNVRTAAEAGKLPAGGPTSTTSRRPSACAGSRGKRTVPLRDSPNNLGRTSGLSHPVRGRRRSRSNRASPSNTQRNDKPGVAHPRNRPRRMVIRMQRRQRADDAAS